MEHNPENPIAPTETLKSWAGTLSEKEIAEVNHYISIFVVNKAALIVLNESGLTTLQQLITLRSNPDEIIEGFNSIGGAERSFVLSKKRSDLEHDFEKSLRVANDKLWDKTDEEIATCEEEARGLFPEAEQLKEAA